MLPGFPSVPSGKTHPPHLADDVAKLPAKGVKVYVVEEDMAERGIEPSDLVEGLSVVGRDGIGALVSEYDHVWHW